MAKYTVRWSVLIFLGIVYVLSATKGTPHPTDSIFKKHLVEWLDNSSASGIAVGFIQGGKCYYLGEGYQSFDGEQPITKHTIFEIGSLTKLFTSVLLAVMVHEGLLALDDEVSLYMPELRAPITSRQLATHTSGLPRLPTNFGFDNPLNPYASYTMKELYEYVAILRLAEFSYCYSNLGYGLLGHVLEAVSHTSYEQLIQKRICSQLSLDSTSTILSPSMKARSVQKYVGDKAVPDWDFNVLHGCGALHSSLNDMVRFLSCNMGVYDASISSAMKVCHEHQVMLPEQKMSIGLGWRIYQDDTSKLQIVWHDGSTLGCSSFIGFSPERQVGMVVLSNSSDSIIDLGFMLLTTLMRSS